MRLSVFFKKVLNILSCCFQKHEYMVVACEDPNDLFETEK